MFSTRHVAKMLGVSPKTIQNYLRDGKIPYSFRLPGGEHRFSEADLQAIRDAYGMGGAPDAPKTN